MYATTVHSNSSIAYRKPNPRNAEAHEWAHNENGGARFKDLTSGQGVGDGSVQQTSEEDKTCESPWPWP